VQRRDNRLRQIRAGRAFGKPQLIQAAGDTAPIPPAAILFVKRNQRTTVIDPGATARIMQQHQRGERVRVTVARHQ
jgi:hypothetical protein